MEPSEIDWCQDPLTRTPRAVSCSPIAGGCRGIWGVFDSGAVRAVLSCTHQEARRRPVGARDRRPQLRNSTHRPLQEFVHRVPEGCSSVAVVWVGDPATATAARHSVVAQLEPRCRWRKRMQAHPISQPSLNASAMQRWRQVHRSSKGSNSMFRQ